MALGHSPGIVTNGLIFAYDMNNTGKSFLGAPATNLYGANLGDVNSVTSWDKPTAGTATITDSVVTNLGSFNGNRIWRVTVSAGTLVSYSSWRNCLPAGFDATYGTTRRLSCKIFMEKGSITAIGAHNGGGNGSYSAGDWSDVDPNTVTGCEIKSGWKQYDVNVSGNYPSGHCVGLAILSSDIQFLVTEMAVTNTSFRVPFTGLSRSTSQVLFDTVGNRSMVANSLTYASNNTFTFDSSNNYITPSSSTISDSVLNAGSWTISAWVNMTSVSRGTDNVVCGHGSASTSNGLHLGERNSRVYFGFYANDSSGVIPLSANTWYNIVYTYNFATKLKQMYVNGVFDASGGSVGYGGTGSNFEIGRYPWATNYKQYGSMPYFAMYNRVLTAAEILQNFNAIRSRYSV